MYVPDHVWYGAAIKAFSNMLVQLPIVEAIVCSSQVSHKYLVHFRLMLYKKKATNLFQIFHALLLI